MANDGQYRVTALRLGRLNVCAADLLSGAHPDERMDVPVWAALIEGRGHKVLVDTGVRDPAWVLRTLGNPCSQHADEALPGALAHLGVDVGEIDILINTHLHFDHCGYNGALAGAQMYVSRVEWDDAHVPPASQRSLYDKQDWLPESLAAANYTLIDTDPYVVLDGITVIQTPGHSSGHQSVLVEIAEGVVCIAGDAVSKVDSFQTGEPPGITVSREDAVRSIAKIAMGADRVLMGHDLELARYACTGFPAIPK